MNRNDKHIAATVPSPSERVRERIKLKVCGMKYQDNIEQVAALRPDYLGFIFYNQSARSFDSKSMPDLPKSIKKTGVFVNADLNTIIEKIKIHKLQAVQLHGEESPEYCLELKRHYEERNDEVISSKEADCFTSTSLNTVSLEKKSRNNEKLEIIKAFSINPDSYRDEFNFDVLKPYEAVCDYFLFDTKGKLPGGNGYTFDWNVLNNYPSTKPFFLSGGIGLDELEKLKEFQQSKASKYCYAIDVNSKFEVEAGLKDIDKLKDFKNNLCHFE